MSFSRRLDKLPVVILTVEDSPATKRETHTSMGGPYVHFAKAPKDTSRLIPVMSHSGKGKAIGMEHIWKVLRVWGWGQDWLKKGTRKVIFRVTELVCKIPWWWLRNSMHLSKPTEESEFYFVKLKIMNQKVRGSQDEMQTLTDESNCIKHV